MRCLTFSFSWLREYFKTQNSRSALVNRVTRVFRILRIACNIIWRAFTWRYGAFQTVGSRYSFQNIVFLIQLSTLSWFPRKKWTVEALLGAETRMIVCNGWETGSIYPRRSVKGGTNSSKMGILRKQTENISESKLETETTKSSERNGNIIEKNGKIRKIAGKHKKYATLRGHRNEIEKKRITKRLRTDEKEKDTLEEKINRRAIFLWVWS